MTGKIKTFLSIDDIISNIKSKNIKIKNEKELKIILEHNNYYFIQGYKELFKKSDGSYKDNIYFEDIYEFYRFDKKIKLLFAEILFEIEQSVKTIFTNNFCNRYGFNDIDLLDPSNYDKNNPYLIKILSDLSNQINYFGKTNDAILYYRSTYNFVPIWVLNKVLSFGMIRDLIFCQDVGVKSYVSKKIIFNKNASTKDVQNMLELLVTYRNICCHDDVLCGFRHRKVNIMNTPYHCQFKLTKDKNGAYIQGKKDMFAALIAIKYFVNENEYKNFIISISNLINDFTSKINSINRNELLEYMNLPIDFERIKDL